MSLCMFLACMGGLTFTSFAIALWLGRTIRELDAQDRYVDELREKWKQERKDFPGLGRWVEHDHDDSPF